LVHWVERLEPRADQHVLVRTGAIGLPRELSATFIERGEPAANAHLAARIADDDFAVRDQRRHRQRLALLDVAELRAPHLLAGPGVDRDRLPVERIEDDLAVRIDRAAIDRAAAGDALRRRRRFRLEHPFLRCAGPGQVERVEIVGKRRDQVHCPVDDERRRFVAVGRRGREREGEGELGHVRGRDLVERREPSGGIILARHFPIAVVGRGCRSGGERVRAGRHLDHVRVVRRRRRTAVAGNKRGARRSSAKHQDRGCC